MRRGSVFGAGGQAVEYWVVERLPGSAVAVVSDAEVFVANTGSQRLNDKIALRAAGALLDIGLLAWPIGVDLLT